MPAGFVMMPGPTQMRPPQPILGWRGGLGLMLERMGQGYGQGVQQRTQEEQQQRRIEEERSYIEQQRLAQIQRQMADIQTMQQAQMQPQITGIPQMQSQAGSQMALGGLGQKMWGDPFGVQRARAGLLGTQRKILETPPPAPLLTPQEQKEMELYGKRKRPEDPYTKLPGWWGKATEQQRQNYIEKTTQIPSEIGKLPGWWPKATKKQKQAYLDRVGGPQVEISLGKPASASERTAIAETRASIDALDNLKALFDSTKTKVGPIKGRIAPTAGLLGLTTDEQEAFMAATSAFKNAVIKDITGAQMSEVEAKRIMKQIPDITDPPTRWLAKWRQTKRNLEFIQRRRTQVLRQSGLRPPQGKEAILPDLPSGPDPLGIR